MDDPSRYCTFRLGEAVYALDVQGIQEVLRGCEWSAVPLAPPSVLGLMNLRGQIVTVVDLAVQLGLGARERSALAGAPSVQIVLSCARPPVCLAVDEVGDVVELSAASLLAPPATLDERARARVRGLHWSDRGLITLLETSALLEDFLEPTIR